MRKRKKRKKKKLVKEHLLTLGVPEDLLLSELAILCVEQTKFVAANDLFCLEEKIKE